MQELQGTSTSSGRNDENEGLLTGRQRESTASIKAGAKPYEQVEPAKPQNILEFDCRGLEFVEFKPEGDWLAEGTDSNTKFTGIDLTDDWFDYDEKAGEEVSVQSLKWEIKRA